MRELNAKGEKIRVARERLVWEEAQKCDVIRGTEEGKSEKKRKNSGKG